MSNDFVCFGRQIVEKSDKYSRSARMGRRRRRMLEARTKRGAHIGKRRSNGRCRSANAADATDASDAVAAAGAADATVDRRDVADGAGCARRRVAAPGTVRRRGSAERGAPASASGRRSAGKGQAALGRAGDARIARGNRRDADERVRTTAGSGQRRSEREAAGRRTERENPGRPRRPVVAASHPDQAGSANCATAERSASA